MPDAPLETTISLLTRAKEGDTTALDQLVERSIPPLRRWARGRLPTWARGLAETQDLVQDAVMRTLPRLATFEAAHPGALQTVEIWAGYNGAGDPVTDPVPLMDLDLAVPGLDTVITRYTNAPPGGAVELWTINGGRHFPTLNSGGSASEFSPRVIDWLLAHPKP